MSVLLEQKSLAEIKELLYSASPFDLGSDNDNLYRNAIDEVLDNESYRPIPN